MVGCRDRSWGVRSVGAPLPGPAREPQFYWLWAPVSFDDVCTHMDVCEDAAGGRWHETGFVVPVGSSGAPSPAVSMDYRIEWRPGTRRAAWAEIDLAVDGGADLVTVRLEPIIEFQMTGLGYINADWNHGAWKGELAVGGSRWALPVEDPLAFHHLHIQALCRATMGDKVGIGVLEQLVFGPHSPSRFSSAPTARAASPSCNDVPCSPVAGLVDPIVLDGPKAASQRLGSGRERAAGSDHRISRHQCGELPSLQSSVPAGRSGRTR